jgi:hypothetical protein
VLCQLSYSHRLADYNNYRLCPTKLEAKAQHDEMQAINRKQLHPTGLSTWIYQIALKNVVRVQPSHLACVSRQIPVLSSRNSHSSYSHGLQAYLSSSMIMKFV